MTNSRCIPSLVSLGSLLTLCLSLLAGCASGGGATGEGRGLDGIHTPTLSGGRDLRTASDESNVRRRASIRLELAAAYYSQQQYTIALDEIKKALAVDGNYSEAYEMRALIYDALNEPAYTDESYRKAIQLDSNNGSAMHNYAWWLCGRQQYEPANALFERASQMPRSVDSSKTLLAQGVCQQRAGKLLQAEQTLKRAFDLDPGSPATAFNLASVLFQKGEFDRARFYIRRVNNTPQLMTAESLWLGVRVEHRLNNYRDRDDLAAVLRQRFSASREATALELGRFDD